MEMVWKGIVGGLVTAAIVWLSKRGNTLPGILPLFPTFALIALLIVGAKGKQYRVPRGLHRRRPDHSGLPRLPGGVLFHRRSHRLPAGTARRACGVAGGRAGDLPRPALDLTTIPIP